MATIEWYCFRFPKFTFEHLYSRCKISNILWVLGIWWVWLQVLEVYKGKLRLLSLFVSGSRGQEMGLPWVLSLETPWDTRTLAMTAISLLNVSNVISKNSRMPLVYIQLLILTAVLGGKTWRDYHPILYGEVAEAQRQYIPYCHSCRHWRKERSSTQALVCLNPIPKFTTSHGKKQESWGADQCIALWSEVSNKHQLCGKTCRNADVAFIKGIGNNKYNV